jgi:hypothetical protein
VPPVRHQAVQLVIGGHDPGVSRQAEFPGGFDAAPASFDLVGQVPVLVLLGEAEAVVGQAVAVLPGGPLVGEKSLPDRAGADHVEGVDDVVEPQANGGFDKLLLDQLPAVELAAGIEELA